MTNSFSKLGSALLLAGFLASGTPALAKDSYNWDMPNTFGANSSDGVADTVFGKLIEDKTKGRIKITHHFNGSLGYRGVDLLNAVQDGAVPIARHSMSYYGGYDPIFLLSTLPFLIKDTSDVDKMIEVSTPYLKKKYLEYNQVLISFGLFPPSGVWSRKPINGLGDLKGLKIRAFDLNSLETFNGAGAAAINMNWGDVAPALSTGAIDAVVTSADLGNASGINDYLPNFLEINWAIPLSTITVNKDVWDALPKDLQDDLSEVGAETTKQTVERLKSQVAENYKEMRAKGVTVNENAPDDVMKALRASANPVIENWRKKAGDEAKALDEYEAAIKK